MDKEKEFVLGGSRFDQQTFYGRFMHFLNVIDPRTLLTSEQQLKNAVELLQKFEDGTTPANATNKDLWNAQKIKQAMIHPDTGEKIPMPFRMSGFVPFGSPIVVGLLYPSQTLLSTTFWQWLNQSHNACVNYCNRNATQKTSVQDIVLGYAGAVTTAVSIALGLSVVVKKATTLNPVTRTLIQRFIPFPAVASASACNVILMRHNEIFTGIEVVDSQDQVVGVSKVAAKKALEETALTRFFLPAPTLLIPPICLALLEKTKWFRRYPRLNFPAQVLLTTASFALALPLAIALFPQKSSIATTLLEDDIRSRATEERLFYNKGL